jgi:response regulator RpfG family c-di-GMP phosphodiesterase
MNAKILFVDDDPNILAAYQRNLRREYAIDIALGGEKALVTLETHGPYAVVVADMRMPGMDGVELLKRVQTLCPDTVRIMLTGNADLGTAKDAVNHGHIFRFLTKPCPTEDLLSALNEGLHQYDLVCAERELLEQTLTGAIKVLTEMLSTADPVSFGLAARAADLAEEVGRRMGVKENWSLRIATLLAPIGLVTLPPALLDRHRKGKQLEPKEQELLQRIPEVGAKLLASIPRLEEVARIIQYQNKNYDGSGFPLDRLKGTEIPIQSRILKAVSDFVRCQCRRSTPAEALEQLGLFEACYDPEVLRMLRDMFQGEDAGAAEAPPISEVGLGELRVGQILASPVETMEGTLILPKGTPLTFSHLEKVHNYSNLTGVREPIQVFEI